MGNPSNGSMRVEGEQEQEGETLERQHEQEGKQEQEGADSRLRLALLLPGRARGGTFDR